MLTAHSSTYYDRVKIFSILRAIHINSKKIPACEKLLPKMIKIVKKSTADYSLSLIGLITLENLLHEINGADIF